MLLFGAPEGTVIGCFMELVSYFPIDCVIYFSTGQAVAAVIMNIVKYISLGCFPVIEGSKNEEKKFNLWNVASFRSHFAYIGSMLCYCY